MIPTGTTHDDHDDHADGSTGTAAAPGAACPGARSPRRRRRLASAVAASVMSVWLVAGTAVVTRSTTSMVSTTAAETTTDPVAGVPGTTSGPGTAARPWSSDDGEGSGTAAPGAGPGTFAGTTAETDLGTLDVDEATDEQTTGVVVVETVLGYEGAEAAGTGVVLTSSGLVVTNNHVVEGATSITVTTADGVAYTATVVGTDSTDDVAVLALEDASGLAVADLDDDAVLDVGDEVTAVGNALGEGLVAARGTVTALEATVTTSAEGSVSSETLDDLIEVDADVVSGDSGGALLDDEGEVVGLTTAASSGASTITGYAITIEDVLDVVAQIEAGIETDTVMIGYPAFLGVELASSGSVATTDADWGGPGTAGGVQDAGAAPSTSPSVDVPGATVAGVVDGTPAAGAGLAAGDVITALDGTTVTSDEELSDAVAAHDPGDTVTLTWTSATTGESQTATVTLATGGAA